MVGGDLLDWSTEEWLRGIRVDKGPPSNSHHLFYHFTMSRSFQTDNSNLTHQHLYPRVTDPHSTTSYSLDSAVGTITQIDNCSYEHAFNGQSPYMTNQQVRSSVIDEGVFEDIDSCS